MSAFGHLCSFASSNIGRKRKNNEDAWGECPEHGVFVVADGMGGADEGEFASRTLVTELCQTFHDAPPTMLPLSVASKERMLRVAADVASRVIRAHVIDANLQSCGSTLVAALFSAESPARLSVVHAGDSRAYLFGQNGLARITRDHSVAEAAGVDDEMQLPKRFKGMLTRAVGMSERVNPERTEVPVNENDILLLCSDGLTRMASDARIESLLKRYVAENASIEAIVTGLVGEAITLGGVDNVTVLGVKVGALPAAREVENVVPSHFGGSDHDSTDVSFTGSGPSTPTVNFTPTSDVGGIVPVGDRIECTPVSAPSAEEVIRTLLRRVWGCCLFWYNTNRKLAAIIAGVAVLVFALASLGIQCAFRKPLPVTVAILDRPDAASDWRLEIKQASSEHWGIVTNSALTLIPGDYNARWTRRDYEPIEAHFKVGRQPVVTLVWPLENDWRPSAPLQRLMDLEAAVHRKDTAAIREYSVPPQMPSDLDDFNHKTRLDVATFKAGELLRASENDGDDADNESPDAPSATPSERSCDLPADEEPVNEPHPENETSTRS